LLATCQLIASHINQTNPLTNHASAVLITGHLLAPQNPGNNQNNYTRSIPYEVHPKLEIKYKCIQLYLCVF